MYATPGSRWDLGPMFTATNQIGPMIPSYYMVPVSRDGWRTATGYFAAGSAAESPSDTILPDSADGAWGRVAVHNPFAVGARGAGYPWSSSQYTPPSYAYRGVGATAGAGFSLLNLVGLGIALWFGAKIARGK